MEQPSLVPIQFKLAMIQSFRIVFTFPEIQRLEIVYLLVLTVFFKDLKSKIMLLCQWEQQLGMQLLNLAV